MLSITGKKDANYVNTTIVTIYAHVSATIVTIYAHVSATIVTILMSVQLL